MGFQLSQEQQAIRQTVREFADDKIRPKARKYDEKRIYPEDILKEAADYDFIAPLIPTEYGGGGMDLLSSVIVEEELWRGDPSIGHVLTGISGLVYILTEYGDEWMREEWFPRIASGESTVAMAISEPAYGSNVAGIETKAEEDTDGWILNGNKMWISEGNVADVCIVFAKTDPDEGHRGISIFLVPTDTDGYSSEEISNKMGLRCSPVAEVILDNVKIPKDHLIGNVNDGFYYLMESFEIGRVHVAAQSIGTSQAALEASKQYASERQQFGKPISDYQAIQHKIAEMATSVATSRALTYQATEKVADGDEQASNMASMSKLHASENAVDVADKAVQVHGGAGYVTDHPVERYYRDARILKIYEGTSEIQKNIISDNTL